MYYAIFVFPKESALAYLQMEDPDAIPQMIDLVKSCPSPKASMFGLVPNHELGDFDETLINVLKVPKPD